jgi:hypothetical protein
MSSLCGKVTIVTARHAWDWTALRRLAREDELFHTTRRDTADTSGGAMMPQQHGISVVPSDHPNLRLIAFD